MEEKNTEQLSELSGFKIDSSKGEDNTDVQVVKYRKMLNKLIVTIFTDIKKVAEDLEKQTPVSPTLLTCVDNCREEFPHIFVMERLRNKYQECMETDVGDINLNVTVLSSDNQSILALGFTQWLLSQLIRLLTFPELRELHNSCVQLLASILGTVKLGDVVSFSHLCQLFIQLTLDLENFKENCYRSGYNTNSLFTTQSFKISEEALKVNNAIKAEEKLDFSVIPIILKSVEGCESFQVQVMFVMELLVFDLLQFTPGSKEKLWNILCKQLELGGIDLKLATLSVMQNVLSASGLPDIQTTFCQFFSCLLGLVQFCCSEKQSKHSNIQELETRLSSVLEKTVCVLDYTPLVYSVDATILYCSTIDLVEILGRYGLYQLTTEKLGVAIVDTFTYLMSYLTRRNFSIPKKLIESLSEVLLNHCGKIVNSRCVKTAVLYIQREELKQLSAHNPTIQEKPVQHQASTSRLSTKRKRASDDIKGGEPLKFQEDTCRNSSWKSPGMNAIHKKICELTEKACEKMRTENVADVKYLNGLTTCVDIVSSLSSIETQNDESTSLSDGTKRTLSISQMFEEMSPHPVLVSLVNLCLAVVLSPSLTSSLLLSCVKLINSLLELAENEDLNMEIQQKACFIISLPWLSEAQPTHIQNFKVGKVTNEQKSQWSVTVTEEVTIECLQVLMTLPGQMFPEWRLHVLRNVMHERKEQNVEVLLHNLPLFCFLVKQNSDKISSDVIRLAIEMDNMTLHVAVAEILGKLSCILSGEAVFIRSLKTSDQGAVSLKEKLVCSRCQSEKIGGSFSPDQTLDKPIWISEIILNLLKHENSVVKKATISSFPSVFAHLPITEQLLSSCLELMKDPDFEVRFSFSKIVQHMIKPFGKPYPEGWTVQYDELLVSKLKTVFCVAQKNRNIHLQKTVILTMGQIGKVATDNLLLISIVCLLESLFSKILLITTAAKLQMKKLAEVKNVKMIDLFKQFKFPICKFLMEAMLECCSRRSVEVLFILNEFVSIFGYPNTRTFLSSTLRYMLPPLATKASPEASMLLKILAKQMRMQKQELLMNHFKYIFSYLVRHCSKEEMEKALTYVQTETNIEIGSLLRCDYQRIHNELLLHISTHYEQVFSGLAMLAWKDESYDGTKPITKPEDMAKFLQPRLLGFLAFFDSQLLNANFPLEEKKLALGSLNSIMELMGPKHITAVRMKVMATLKIAIRFTEEDFPQICTQAWNTFVHNVELQSLGSLLNQVMTALLPLLQFHPQGVATIFHFLVVENRKNLNEYFHDLYFIPELAELTEVNTVLKEYIDRPSKQADFHSLLSHSLKGVSHENLEVCFHALRKVKQLLCSHQSELLQYLLEQESADPLISQLMSVIISRCRETDPIIRLALAECIGELGAIDNGRLEMRRLSENQKSSFFYLSVEDENFAYDLVQKLVRSFLAAEDTRIQDCASYALQETLHIYTCQSGESSQMMRPSGTLWNRFSEEVQEILVPLQHSRYIMSSNKRTSFPCPIYGSKLGNTFKDWACNWACCLLQKIKRENTARVFQSCFMIVKNDVKTAVFLLPHIMVNVLQDASNEEKEEIYREIMAVLSHVDQAEQSKSKFHEKTDLCHLSAQTVFSILDCLTVWCHQYFVMLRSSNQNHSKPANKGKVDPHNDPNYKSVYDFLKSVPEDLLARASFVCQAYARALMYLELSIKNNQESSRLQLAFLQKLYILLDEQDGVAGVAASRQEDPTLHDLILGHEATGQLQDAFSCYERAVKVQPDTISHHQGLLRCLMGLDQSKTALTYATGLLNERPEWSNEINPFRVESAWKLADWDGLSEFLKSQISSDNWGVAVGKILLSTNKKENEKILEQLKIVRTQQMGPLSAASMENGAYQRGYSHVLRLHMLTDMEKAAQVFTGLCPSFQGSYSSVSRLNIDKLLEEWRGRRKLVQSSLRYQEPLLNLYRVLLTIAKNHIPEQTKKIDYEIVTCWLQSAKLARKSGHQQRAYSCLLEASVLNIPETFVEKSKWHWNKNEQEQAINILQKGIQEHFPDVSQFKNNPSQKQKEAAACAKATLMLAKYSEESAVLESNALILMYRDVVAIQPEWEEGHFHLAKYYDRVMTTLEKSEKKSEVIVHMVQCYGRSLQYGCRHLFHSMPRMLSLWFDLGTQVVEHQKSKKPPQYLEQWERMLNVMTTKVIPNFVEKLPPYLFYTAFSQLISRICHSHSGISLQLQDIIARLLVSYSQQVMWMIMTVSKSSYQMRRRRCLEIFNKANKVKPELSKFINDATCLADQLLDLCNKKVETIKPLSINQHMRSLPRLITERDFSQILLPVQSVMTVTLPSKMGSECGHNPFPQTPVYIQGFEDTIEILPSLQRPKKITIRGSDGNKYPMMCKPKDDLRKDCRLMEFTNLVNKCLKEDPEARKRQLYIRTYAVIPLNEECGLVEWVSNLNGLRQILNKIYKQKGLFTSGRELQSMAPANGAPLETKMEAYKKNFLPRFPPVFSEWFLTTFLDPTAWYLARLAYCRTTAVMSMVGYVLGLGDRHGENLLMDSSCGDTVHVDFNCLFNKGETFDCPERVPFRLTHNMVEAMGPLGYEGIFRKACEVTMKVMRNQKEALMSVLKPFVYDPLVEWSKSTKSLRSVSLDSGEINNEKALIHVRDIEQRLKGVVRSKLKGQGLPLSIEGQVNYLIQEATDERLLCQMYVGWAAYM